MGFKVTSLKWFRWQHSLKSSGQNADVELQNFFIFYFVDGCHGGHIHILQTFFGNVKSG